MSKLKLCGSRVLVTTLLLFANIGMAAVGHSSESKLELYVNQISKNTNSPYKDLELFIGVVKNQQNHFPEEYHQRILKFKLDKNRSYILFKNLPLDRELCATPGDIFNPNDKKAFTSEILLTSFATELGEPFNYIQEEQGTLFRNIRPTKINQYKQTSDSSKQELELHTETAFHSFKPDFLMLYCLRGDRNKQAYTIVAKLDDILNELRDNKGVIEILKQPLYSTGIDVSFGNTDKDISIHNIPILYTSETEGNMMITYDLDLMRATTKESQEAFEILTKAIRKVQKLILLEPGDMLIFDNKRVVHGRTAFKAYFDGSDRWLQRVYVSKNEDFVRNINASNRVITAIN